MVAANGRGARESGTRTKTGLRQNKLGETTRDRAARSSVSNIGGGHSWAQRALSQMSVLRNGLIRSRRSAQNKSEWTLESDSAGLGTNEEGRMAQSAGERDRGRQRVAFLASGDCAPYSDWGGRAARGHTFV